MDDGLIGLVADHDRAGDVLNVGRAGGDGGAPRVGRLLAVLKNIVDDYRVGAKLWSVARGVVVRRDGVLCCGSAHHDGGSRHCGSRHCGSLVIGTGLCVGPLGGRGVGALSGRGVGALSGRFLCGRGGSRLCRGCGCGGGDHRVARRRRLGDDGAGCGRLDAHALGGQYAHGDGVAVGDVADVVGEAAAYLGGVAVQEVRDKRVAQLELTVVRAGYIRPHVAADMYLPLVDTGAGSGVDGKLGLGVLAYRDVADGRGPVGRANLHTGLAGERGGQRGGQKSEHYHAAEKQ